MLLHTLQPGRLRFPRVLSWLSVALVLLVSLGCSRKAHELANADAEPAEAVNRLADHLQRNDLVGYAHALVTDEQFAGLDKAWRDGRSQWPLTEAPLAEDLPSLIIVLSAPGSEDHLMAVFDKQLAGQEASLRQAARSLGVFGVQYLRNQPHYTPEERALYVQLVTALSQWIGTAPLTDRRRAKAAIDQLAKAARATGLDDPQAFRDAGIDETLRRLEPFVKVFKNVLANYGLSVNDALEDFEVGLVTEQKGTAVVRMQYPLADKTIDATTTMVRVQDHWYPRQTQVEVAKLLSTPASHTDIANAQTPAGR